MPMYPDLFGDIRRRFRQRFSGSSRPVATLISATVRTTIPQVYTGSLGGSTNQQNPVIYERIRHKSNKTLTGLQAVYWNGGVNVGGTDAYYSTGRHEQGIGASVTLRKQFTTGPTAVTADTGGVANVCTWAGVAGQASLAAGAVADGKPVAGQFIWKNDRTQTPSVMTPVTFAQFTADGGSVVSSTCNGATVANSQITIPDNYMVISDQSAANVSAGGVYYEVGETQPIIVPAASSITVAMAGVITYQLAAPCDARLMVGNAGLIAGATGNTTVNGTWPITAISADRMTITLSAPAATTAAVNGGRLYFGMNTNAANAQVTTNPLGDWFRAASAQVNSAIGGTSMAAVNGGNNTATDGYALSGCCAILGTSATGDLCVFGHGDSLGNGKGDYNTDSGGTFLQGDADAARGVTGRPLNRLGYSSINVTVPGETSTSGTTNNDDKVRRWLAGFCDVMYNEMGGNDSGSITGVTQMNANYRPRLRSTYTAPRIVNITLSPKTTAVGGDNFKSGRNSTYQTFAGNYAINQAPYTTFNPAVKALQVNNDAYLDIAYYIGNLDGTGVIDGYWPVDGVNPNHFTIDGSHCSRDGYIGVDAQLTASIVKAAIGF